jgi:hypothetical protein
MDRAEIVELATQLIDYYTEKLLLDQFWNFKVEITDGDFYCQTIKDPKSALSWLIRLNPGEHKDVYDIQYSVIEALLKVLLTPLEDADDVKRGIIARLTTALCNMSLEEEDHDNEEE